MLSINLTKKSKIASSLLAFTIALGFSSPALAQTEATPSADAGQTTADGIYTEEQATRGKPVYARACALCHGDKLQGSASAPPLSGFSFTSYWAGKSLDELWDVLHSMPADNPGSLTEQQYADILALMLQSNGYPAGAAEVAADAAALATVTMVAAP